MRNAGPRDEWRDLATHDFVPHSAFKLFSQLLSSIPHSSPAPCIGPKFRIPHPTPHPAFISHLAPPTSRARTLQSRVPRSVAPVQPRDREVRSAGPDPPTA